MTQKKLEERRRRIMEGFLTKNQFHGLNSSGIGKKKSADYYIYTPEQIQILQLDENPKKKMKSLVMKNYKLEAEAVSAVGSGGGHRNADGKRQALHREEHERSEAEKRGNAYQSSFGKAEEASKALRLDLEQTTTFVQIQDEDDDDLRKSLERARKLGVALKRKQDHGAESITQAIALLDSSTGNNGSPVSGESHENKVVFTDLGEFVWGLQHLHEVAQKPPTGEDLAPKAYDQTPIANNQDKEEGEEEIVPDHETFYEVAVGKGLSNALKLLRERGTLEETNILTQKEAFRRFSHKFHGKGSGKCKQGKLMRQYQYELKLKQMN